jgi:hypothetical protein
MTNIIGTASMLVLILAGATCAQTAQKAQPQSQQTSPVVAQPSGWQLVWSDEFNGAAGTPPDPANWNFDLGGGGWGNGEAETYTNSASNVFQDGKGN